MKKYLFVLVICWICIPDTSLAQQETADIVVGKIVMLNSELLGEKRPVYISLPPSYNKSNKNYPLLFVLDGRGNHVFSAGLLHFLSQTGRYPDLILVGIPNVDRGRDLTPSVNGGYKSGGAELFIKHLETELIPYINQNYRTENFRILYGHSLAGLFSVYCFANHPKLFKSCIAVSPALNYNSGSVFSQIKNKFDSLPDEQRMIYIAQGKEPGYLGDSEKLVDLLDDEANDNLLWKFDHFEEEDHSSVRLRAMYRGLEFIFDKWQIQADEIADGADAIEEKYKNLSNKYGYNIIPDEETINIVGYAYSNAGRMDDAIKIFMLNCKFHPDSPNVYDSLGESYENDNQYNLALESYKKALELSEKQLNSNREIFLNNFIRVKNKILQ